MASFTRSNMRPIQRLKLITCLLPLLAWHGQAAESTPTTPARPDALPSNSRRSPESQRRGFTPPVIDASKIERDVSYGKAGGVDLKLDLYFPKKSDSKPSPVAVYV